MHPRQLLTLLLCQYLFIYCTSVASEIDDFAIFPDLDPIDDGMAIESNAINSGISVSTDDYDPSDSSTYTYVQDTGGSSETTAPTLPDSETTITDNSTSSMTPLSTTTRTTQSTTASTTSPPPDIPQTKPPNLDNVRYIMEFSLSLHGNESENWDTVPEWISDRIRETFLFNISAVDDVTFDTSPQSVQDDFHERMNHTFSYNVSFIYETIQALQVSPDPPALRRSQIGAIRAVSSTSQEEIADILTRMIGDVFSVFITPRFFDSYPVDEEYLNDIIDNLGNYTREMLANTVCDLIAYGGQGDIQCNPCYLFDAGSCTDINREGFCNLTCNLDQNQQCVITNTATTPWKTDCRCADKYLPVGSDCVHEGIIIGCSVAAACVVVIALVASIIYARWINQQNNKPSKYQELTEPGGYSNVMMMADREERFSDTSKKVSETNELANVELQEKELTDTTLSTQNGQTVTKKEEDNDTVSSCQRDYWNIPPETSESASFRYFSPCLDGVDTEKEYKLARARIAH